MLQLAQELVNTEFSNMEGAAPALVADRKNARSNSVDESSGILVPLLKLEYRVLQMQSMKLRH